MLNSSVSPTRLAIDRWADAQLRSWAYKIAGFLVSALFVYLAVRRVDLSESLRVLTSVSLPLLITAMFVYLSSYPVRALRWSLILRVQKNVSFKNILSPVFVGYMANNLLPARVGELYRIHFLGQKAGIRRSGVAASVVVERAFDGMMLVLVILLVLVLFPQSDFLGYAALFTVLVFVALAGGIFVYVLLHGKTGYHEDRLFDMLPKSFRDPVRVRMKFFLNGMRGISNTGDFALAMGYTVVIWLCEALAIALVVVAFGIWLPVSGYLLVFSLAAISTTLPSGPGYVGPYQYAFILSLSMFAISREVALAVSVAAQVTLLGSVTVIGLVLLWKSQLSFSALKKEEKARGG